MINARRNLVPQLCSSRSRRAIALGLVLLLSPVPALLGQISSVASGQAASPMALHIVILDGENALNNIRQRTAREPIVQVEDENHKPVAGAAVLFTIRRGKAGAGGTFAGAATLTVLTGASGQAIASGFTPNTIQGQFTIEVTATAGSLITRALIDQTNVTSIPGIGEQTPAAANTTSPAPSAVRHSFFSHQFWAVAAGVAAAGAVVATTVVLTNNSGATITAGTGTVKP